MDEESRLMLRRQAETAIACGTLEAYTALAQNLVTVLDEARGEHPKPSTQEDDLARALQVFEDSWFNNSAPPDVLPGDRDIQIRFSDLLSDLLAVQKFALAISRGDLSLSLRARGMVAGSFKALQSSLRHLTWQTQKIAQGDFNRRVDFMGDFSQAFNSMVEGLAEARDRIRQDAERLQCANAELASEIAERKRTEEDLRKANDLLEERVRERTAELSRINESLRKEIGERKKAEENLTSSLVKLEWANRELNDFAFIASHDLQEPLRKIQLLGDCLKRQDADGLTEAGCFLLERMQVSAERMRNQIRALLDYARLTMKAELFQPVELNSVVADVVAAFTLRLEAEKGTVEVEDLPTVQGDPGQISVLFRHLIDNGLRFRAERDPVIRIYPADGQRDVDGGDRCVVIAVEDNGIGFHEKYLDLLFKPFQRLQNHSESCGMGMGLTVCRKILERHGGTITARSTPQEGSTFLLTFPAVSEV